MICQTTERIERRSSLEGLEDELNPIRSGKRQQKTYWWREQPYRNDADAVTLADLRDIATTMLANRSVPKGRLTGELRYYGDMPGSDDEMYPKRMEGALLFNGSNSRPLTAWDLLNPPRAMQTKGGAFGNAANTFSDPSVGPVIILALRRQGFGGKEIGRRAGCSPQTARRIMESAGMMEEHHKLEANRNGWKRREGEITPKYLQSWMSEVRSFGRLERSYVGIYAKHYLGSWMAMRQYYRDHEESKRRVRESAKRAYANSNPGDPYRLKMMLRRRVRKAIKSQGVSKSSKTVNMVGCTIPFLKMNIESTFKEGMTWDNYGEWHIDHRKPCAAFDLSKEEEQRKCFHWTNLYAEWASDNISKGSKWRGKRHFHRKAAK